MADSTQWVFVQGNRRPSFAVQFKGRDDESIINLTGSSVTLTFKNQRARSAKFTTQAVSIDDAANGKVSYAWAANDLDVTGLFDAEFRITFPDGRVQSVMVSPVQVLEKLG